jgi:hypothetical protein
MMFTHCYFPDLAAWDSACLMSTLARGDDLAPLKYTVAQKRRDQKCNRFLRALGLREFMFSGASK